jgi:creatinine amidohydrolase
MKKVLLLIDMRFLLNMLGISVLATMSAGAQTLSPKWEELTAEDFVKALHQAQDTCTLPFGIIEKHGPSGPMGTDLINVRYSVELAAHKEYTIMFPPYYFGQIFEAKHQPGTIAYSTHLQLELLRETVSEMARNGCRKIIIVSGHGGNTNLVNFFAQTQLETPVDYVLYVISGGGNAGQNVPAAARPSKPGVDGHAGEVEIANVMASRPDLAHPDRAGEESGKDLNRLDLPQGVTTPIWWYARFPNHYQGDAAGATAARGKALMELRSDYLVAAIRAIKADTITPRLQKEFFEKSTHPLDTKQ